MRLFSVLFICFFSTVLFGQSAPYLIHPDCNQWKHQRDQESCTQRAMRAFFFVHLRYHDSDRIEKLSDTVDVAFFFDGNAAISSAESLNAKNERFGAEAERLVTSLNDMDLSVQGTNDENSGPFVDTVQVIFNPDRVNHIINKDGKVEEVDWVFKVVERMPVFPGCSDIEAGRQREICGQEKMLKYIYSNLEYPEEASEKGVQGQVVISFIINKDGSVSNIKILRDKGYGLGEEGARIVATFNDMEEPWEPGRQRGKKVRVQYNLPIKFRLP